VWHKFSGLVTNVSLPLQTISLLMYRAGITVCKISLSFNKSALFPYLLFAFGYALVGHAQSFHRNEPPRHCNVLYFSLFFLCLVSSTNIAVLVTVRFSEMPVVESSCFLSVTLSVLTAGISKLCRRVMWMLWSLHKKVHGKTNSWVEDHLARIPTV
jgi:hypothetical protein